MNKNNYNEIELQKGVHSFLSDPSKVYRTYSDKRLQVLSPGTINKFEGPDLKDIAILLEGNVIVGDGEFHRKTSEWIQHKHDESEYYQDVILHIVMEHDKEIEKHPEILILNEKSIIDEIQNDKKKSVEIKPDSIEDLQNYALMRLLRKSSEAQKLINKYEFNDAYILFIKDFIKRYLDKRRRPGYSIEKMEVLINELINWDAYAFLSEIRQDYTGFINDRLQSLIKKRFSIEGAHLRREIVLNSILPIAVCLADDNSRINLFLWYWSTPSLNNYGILNRRFPDIPQNYLWQQQGMLEFIKENGRRADYVKEMIKLYGFGDVLKFYKLGRSPFLE
jgi:hypothetical protein